MGEPLATRTHTRAPCPCHLHVHCPCHALLLRRTQYGSGPNGRPKQPYAMWLSNQNAPPASYYGTPQQSGGTVYAPGTLSTYFETEYTTVWGDGQ